MQKKIVLFAKVESLHCTSIQLFVYLSYFSFQCSYAKVIKSSENGNCFTKINDMYLIDINRPKYFNVLTRFVIECGY